MIEVVLTIPEGVAASIQSGQSGQNEQNGATCRAVCWRWPRWKASNQGSLPPLSCNKCWGLKAALKWTDF